MLMIGLVSTVVGFFTAGASGIKNYLIIGLVAVLGFLFAFSFYNYKKRMELKTENEMLYNTLDLQKNLFAIEQLKNNATDEANKRYRAMIGKVGTGFKTKITEKGEQLDIEKTLNSLNKDAVESFNSLFTE